jgi:putative copper export protein
MTKTKLKFSIITLAALILVLFSGVNLKMNSDAMSNLQMYAWGANFVGSCLTVVKGIKYLGNRDIK